MNAKDMQRYWVKEMLDLKCQGASFANIAYPEEAVAVYVATDIEARDQEIVAFLKDFIEWNACNEIDGVYKCNQCGEFAMPGKSNHVEDCEILEAQRLVRRMTT